MKMPNCCVCGRFCSWSADRSAPFNSMAVGPPEEEFYCDRCAKAQEEHYVNAGWVPNSWIKADWERRAAKRLGFIEVALSRAAWTQWSSPDKIPEGFEPCGVAP
jgi:hypothetical protein